MMFRIRRFLSLVLAFCLLLSVVNAEDSWNLSLPDPNEKIISETIISEDQLHEDVLGECITSEVYLHELVLSEKRISELLLKEDTIAEVVVCKTVYIPENNIDEFAANSQVSRVFGEGVDIGPVLKKVAIGTGIILTLVVLKMTNLPEPVASIVAAAADESLVFAEKGGAIGSLFGGITGALDEIDPSGRMSAVAGFAIATAGLIISIVHLIALIPSGGMSSVGVGLGIRLALAGIGVIGTAYGTYKAGDNLVRKISSTDATNIDWSNIDWEAVGVSAVEQSINYGADGYMWGSIIGAVDGGATGYDYYHKFNTPYTSKKFRIDHTPREDSDKGKWTGERGESEFVLDEPLECTNKTVVKKVNYQNGVPDFSDCAVAEVKVDHITDIRTSNYRSADQALASKWSAMRHEGHRWSSAQVKQYRIENNLTWHEMSNMTHMQLVPTEVNSTFSHCGGVTEYGTMIGQEGLSGID